MGKSMRKQMQECPPLAMLRAAERVVPHFDEELAKIKAVQNNTRIEPFWDYSRCYSPVGITQCIIADRTSMEQATASSMAITAVMSWKKNLTIFDLDDDVAQALCEQAADTTIPTEALRRMPYQCVYIKTSYPRVSKEFIDRTSFFKSSGFFAWIEHDYRRRTYELCLHAVVDETTDNIFTQNTPMSGTIPLLENKTISDCLDETRRRFYEDKTIDPMLSRVDQEMYNVFVTHWEQYIRPALMQALQIVLYLCSDNVDNDIAEHKKKVVHRQIKRSPTLTDIEHVEVGFREGAILRRTAQQYESAAHSEESGRTVRPHMRRGHWHHYWTGARASSNRTLILHWLAPVMVNEEDGELEVVIRKVKE